MKARGLLLGTNATTLSAEPSPTGGAVGAPRATMQRMASDRGDEVDHSRRRLLVSAALLAPLPLSVAAAIPAPTELTILGRPTQGSGAPPWNILPPPTFVEGSGATYDLKSTLPPGTPAGGTFSIDPNGPPLPAGMTLSPDGVLSVGSATATVVTGVIFAYTTP